MKKLLLLILSTLGILYLASCNEEISSMTEASQETESYGITLVQKGKYNEALEYFNSKQSEIITYYGVGSEEACVLYNTLGYIYNNIGQYDMAIEYYTKVIEQKNKQQNYDNLGIAYSGLVTSYQGISDTDNALIYAQKKLDIAKEVYGENSIEFADAKNNYAQIYMGEGELDKALDLEKEALAIVSGLSGEDELRAFYCLKIGHIYFKKNDNKNAQTFYAESINLYEEIFGSNDYITAEGYLAYGRSLVHEDSDLALQYLQKALTVYEQDEVYANFCTITLRNIAWAYDVQGNDQLALKYAIEAYNNADRNQLSVEIHKEYIKEIYLELNKENEEDFESWFKENVLN